MGTTSVSIKATFADGKPLDVLQGLLAKRERFLRGETTENAVRATAINVLSSIRSRTREAKPDKAAEFGVGVMPAPGVVAGYKSAKGVRRTKNGKKQPGGKGQSTQVARLVVRARGGHEMTGAKVVNLAGEYQRGAPFLTFVVIFKSPAFAKFWKGGYERAYVVGRSAAQVRKWAKEKLAKYVKHYKGTAEWLLGQAQSQVHNTNVREIDPRGRKVALRNMIVQATGDGFASGQFSIYVADKLDYATLALPGMSDDVDLAFKKAANRTAAIINRLGRARIDEEIQTPFPEVVGRKR